LLGRAYVVQIFHVPQLDLMDLRVVRVKIEQFENALVKPEGGKQSVVIENEVTLWIPVEWAGRALECNNHGVWGDVARKASTGADTLKHSVFISPIYG
jgi:hypothetical protein